MRWTYAQVQKEEHRKIAVSAEIKKNRDWLRPWSLGRPSQFLGFKGGCSVLWTSGQLIFFFFFLTFLFVWICNRFQLEIPLIYAKCPFCSIKFISLYTCSTFTSYRGVLPVSGIDNYNDAQKIKYWYHVCRLFVSALFLTVGVSNARQHWLPTAIQQNKKKKKLQ